MIRKLEISNFKCFENEKLEFKNLTVLTGTNSSGKSSVIQAMLLIGKHKSGSDIFDYLQSMGDFNDLKNKHINPSQYNISVVYDDDTRDFLDASKVDEVKQGGEQIAFPHNLTYLNANRVSLSEINISNSGFSDRYFGIDGKYIANYFEISKGNPINQALIHNEDTPATLEAQIDYWLERITGQSIRLKTSKQTSTRVEALYHIDGFAYKPNNIGTGVSYIISILVACLSAEKNNIIIIENPEIHLHPKAQSGMGEFFAFVASMGIQIIIETHNDHLINRLRYEVYKDNLGPDEVIIHYKEKGIPFEQIKIGRDGKFIDKNGENSFPKGFYDATLKEIYQINRGQ